MKTTVKEIIEVEEIMKKEREEKETFKGFYSTLRKIFEEFQDPRNWKNPFYVDVLSSEVKKLKAAVEFFHAARLCINSTKKINGKKYVECFSPGYQAW